MSFRFTSKKACYIAMANSARLLANPSAMRKPISFMSSRKAARSCVNSASLRAASAFETSPKGAQSRLPSCRQEPMASRLELGSFDIFQAFSVHACFSRKKIRRIRGFRRPPNRLSAIEAIRAPLYRVPVPPFKAAGHPFR